MRLTGLAIVAALLTTAAARGGAKADIKALLGERIIKPQQTLQELQNYLEPRVPRLRKFQSNDEWEADAKKVRADVLEKVVFRGEAKAWRDAKTEVKWFDTVAGKGYRIKKLRFEALPGLWIPAALYEPEKLSGKVPAALCVMGHDGGGKEVAYQQIRCINLAKRGTVALNVEWLGFGQLKGNNYVHYRMNQLDLCGTSGLAPFYLSLKRGLDVLLAHENADPRRVSVSGLSGGGWQTIFVSALDTRVTLCNPVAGYSSFRTRIRHFKDLGDSEQTPSDLAAVADYTHLTAMLAPRPALLTYNAKDECCFEAGYALPPLLEAALPFYKLHGSAKALRAHVNHVPGTHNYEQENREAFYKMIGDHFFPDDKNYSAKEIPCADEVKKKQELAVPMPEKNADFNSLALALAKKLPREPELPGAKDAAKWQQDRRKLLHDLVRATEYKKIVADVGAGGVKRGNIRSTHRRLALDGTWTVPVVELTPERPTGTVILVNDAGRTADAVNAEKWLAKGKRVLAVDPFFFGEAKVASHDFLFALLVASVGDRPLGLQASQLSAVARWSKGHHKDSVTLAATGPRSSLFALVAAALESGAIGEVELHGSLGSLKQIIEDNRAVNEMPEVFCFGLLERFDVPQLVALVAPRPVRFVDPSPRVRAEMAGLRKLYAALGTDHDPLR